MPELEEIYNFAEVNEKLGTGGQPKKKQFPILKESGYQMVINLAAGQSKRDIPEEPEIVTELGLVYHNIPVDWENPTDDDLQAFFTLMEVNQDKKIFVHCIANFRVSAFVMLYRVIKQGIALQEAKAFKETVWSPEYVYPKWDTFIEKTLKEHKIEG